MDETTRIGTEDDTSKRSSVRKFNKIARNLKGSNKSQVKKVRTEANLKRFSDFASMSEKTLRVGLHSHIKEQSLKGTLSIPKL